MIRKKKIYNYNQQTLRYEKTAQPFGKLLLRTLKFLGISTTLAIAFSAVFYLVWGSLIDNLLQLQINKAKGEFVALNSQMDSLHNHLHQKLFYKDKYYRQLLDLDSLPTPMRLAGTGGAENGYKLEGVDYYELISDAQGRLEVIKNQLKIQDASYTKILKEAVIHNTELKTIPAIQPVKPAGNIWISSRYGQRSDPFTHISRKHRGIDFVGPKNTEIYATADGKVLKIKKSSIGYGKEIIISHEFGYSTRYAHLNEILVQAGDKIKRGQLIGLMGNTGRSTGTHLHYEVRLNRRQINPANFYADDLSAEEYDLITQRPIKEK